MRHSIFAVIVIFGVLLSAAALWAGNSESSKYPDISIKELKAAIAHRNVTLLDANGTDSFQEGHIPGAINFEATADTLARVLPKDKNALIVAYCGGPQCMAYQAAARKAVELGYTNVKHLPAGISGWKDAGEKVEKDQKANKAA